MLQKLAQTWKNLQHLHKILCKKMGVAYANYSCFHVHDIMYDASNMARRN